VRDNVEDDSGDPQEWLARHPPLGSMLIAAMMSWLTSLRHCFAAADEVSEPGGCGGANTLLLVYPQDL
jgi:hypothetical protein